MKAKFLKFVREQWARSEYDSATWDANNNYGYVTFNDGNEIYFEARGTEFVQVEEPFMKEKL